jgi:shikimate kinase
MPSCARLSGHNSEVSLPRRAGDAPMLIELVGPAGAGKSSLMTSLRARDAAIRPNVAIPRWQYVPDALGLAPAFMKFHSPCRRLFWKEMKRMLHLATLHRIVTAQGHGNSGTRVFDEGPVYMLARMLQLGADRFDNEALRHSWEEAAQRWARILRLIVWLDADSATLARRIRSRPGPPPVNDTRDVSLIPFLDRYRACYAEVLQAMTTDGRGPAVITFDTGRSSVHAIAERLIAVVGTPCP